MVSGIPSTALRLLMMLGTSCAALLLNLLGRAVRMGPEVGNGIRFFAQGVLNSHLARMCTHSRHESDPDPVRAYANLKRLQDG